MKTKGQSQIITTILLILIVLAAVVVVWIVVSNFIDPLNNADCVKVKLLLVEAKAADTTTGAPGTVTVKRITGGSDTLVDNIKVVVNGELAASVDKTSSTSELKELETKTYDITKYDASGAVVPIAAGDAIAVGPVLKGDEGEEIICDTTIQGRATA